MSEQQFRIAAFALLASLLVAAAPVVVAQTSGDLVVGSEHTTATDFSSGSITNGDIEGSGEAASVVFDSGPNKTIEGFEDGDTTIETTGWSGWTGDISADSTAIEGSYSGALSPTDANNDATADAGSNVSRSIQFKLNISEDVGSISDETVVSLSNESRDFGYEVVGIEFEDGTNDVIVTSDASDGLYDNNAATWTPETVYRVEVLFFDNSTIRVMLNGQAIAEGTADSAKSEWRYMNFRSSTAGSGSARTARIDSINRVDADTGGTYTSQVHDVSQVQEAFADLSVTDASYTLDWQYYDGSSWVTANTTTGSSSGNITTGLAADADEWRLKLDYEPDGLNDYSKLTLGSEGVLFANSGPSVDNSSASPTGDLTKQQVQLSIDVSDQQFGTPQGESLAVEWYLDGSKVQETTVNSNTTASIDVSDLSGGPHTWSVRVTDSYGGTVASQTFDFNVPDTLYIYNESAPNSLVDNSVNVEVTFFEEGGEKVITRSTSTGKVNLTGLDVGSTFIVRVEASNYHDRTIIIDSLFEQQRVYLLNTSVTSVENQFLLNDLSGQFGDGTKLIIQRPLEINGSTSYQRIVASEFGITGHTTFLEQGVRYRMLVERDGRQRVIGSYPATDGGSVTLEVGQIVYPKPDKAGVAFSASEVTENEQEYIRVRYNDTQGLTERLQITIYERGNKSNVLASIDQSDVQTVMLEPPVQNSETSYVVNVTADRGSSTFSITYPVGGDYRVPIPMDATWLGTIAMVLLTFITALYQSRLATVGSIIVVLVAGTLMLFQFIVIEPMAWWAAAAIAVGGHIRATAGRGGV